MVGGGPFGGPFEHLARALGLIAAGFFWLVVLVVAIGVTVLLVRYLWFGTRAAQRYLQLNPAPDEPTGTASADPESSAPAPTAAAKPTPRKSPRSTG